jgi:predicted aldo/keto reductase-like oxidoreductase
MKIDKIKFEEIVKQRYGSMLSFCEAFGVNRANIYAWFNGREMKKEMVDKLVAFLQVQEMDICIVPPLNSGLLAAISHKLDKIQQETGESLTPEQSTQWLALIYNNYTASGKIDMSQFHAALKMKK